MQGIDDTRNLAQAMVDTVREPLLVMDANLRVITASRSFYVTYETTPAETQGRELYDLGSGEWNNPALRQLLERIVPEHGVMEHFEIEQVFPHLGRRTMLLNAREVFYEGGSHKTLLLAIEDVTDRRAAELKLGQLIEQKDTLLQEMSHRVANSLQIIASILLLKARAVQSEETRAHLQDAHRRVMSVAMLQQQLKATSKGETIDVGPYLSKLCETLAGSMIPDGSPISLKVVTDEGAVTAEQAVSLGLIVTELVINALKYAFRPGSAAGQVVVGYEVKGTDWKLSVADNGGGMAKKSPAKGPAGLGTTLVKALAQQLEAQVETVSNKKGTTVSVIRATFLSRLPTAAASR
jgi:two-component sensor histidine kinase